MKPCLWCGFPGGQRRFYGMHENCLRLSGLAPDDVLCGNQFVEEVVDGDPTEGGSLHG